PAQLPSLGVKREGEGESPEHMSDRKDGAVHEDNMSSTSDFVKKLYKMLEDQTFSNVVCWGPQGDCFVDMNEFTKSILPRMFKHSNFASFVRQLNKYDFHKVKNTDDNQFGDHSWTFRHPDFHANRRDALENIKRKVPAQRKSTSSAQVSSLQAQLTSLNAAHDEVLSHVRNLERNYQEVLVEMVGFQRGMAQQDGLMQNLIQYFLRENNGNGAEAQRMLDKNYPETDVARASLVQMSEISRRAEAVGMSFGGQGSGPSGSSARLGSGVGASGIGAAMSRMDMLARIEELQAQRGRRLNTPLFNNTNNPPSAGSTGTTNPEGGQRTETPESDDYEDEVVQPTPTNPPNLNMGGMTESPDPWAMTAGDTHAGLEVYTVGHLVPRGSGAFPDAQGTWFASTSGGSPPEKQTLRVRRSTFVPGWAVPPRVLLVDDDAVSRKLSSKFLQVFGCAIDVAVDGVGAVNKMNLERYDLDIVMPKLDGVSATSMIRKFDPQTPIISMTSNSRPNEIMTYYSSGMNDILPKPFTKEGLFEMLEKHLTHLTVIKEKIALQAGATSASTSSPDGSSLLGYGFGLGSPDPNDRRINVLAGMGLSDEEYNIMLAGIVNGDGLGFGAGTEKRALILGEGDPDGRDGTKRGRFEVVE
ncbi:HSF-type DNA-binding-domain-containing protein, partial [Mycena pura]